MRANEEAHVRVLASRLRALGGSAPAPPASDSEADKDHAHRKVSGRLGQLKSAKDALGLLIALERVTVGAYYVALITLEQPALITLAAEIMANDAQHEAMVGELLYHGKADQAVPYGLVQGVQ
jgi:ferritin-like protein